MPPSSEAAPPPVSWPFGAPGQPSTQPLSTASSSVRAVAAPRPAKKPKAARVKEEEPKKDEPKEESPPKEAPKEASRVKSEDANPKPRKKTRAGGDPTPPDEPDWGGDGEDSYTYEYQEGSEEEEGGEGERPAESERPTVDPVVSVTTASNPGGAGRARVDRTQRPPEPENPPRRERREERPREERPRLVLTEAPRANPSPARRRGHGDGDGGSGGSGGGDDDESVGSTARTETCCNARHGEEMVTGRSPHCHR